VDTSGAGDVFNGTFAAELAAGLPFDQAVAEAVARASAATLHAGAR
jgi:ribokinase